MMTLILGIGNELLGDEGVGVHAARRLESEPLPDRARVLEVGTGILDALDDLELADRIIVLDAMQAEGSPGTVYKIPLEHCSGAATIASMHGFDIFRVMALAGRTTPPPVTVFGVEPGVIDWSMELSPPVADSLPYLLDAVQEELAPHKGVYVPSRNSFLKNKN
ncbi:MAG: hydrogenase maturation protease [Desulforhopalus sp.]